MRRDRQGAKVRVWRGTGGIFLWSCSREECERAINGGASIHWEVAQLQADEHAREHHPAKPPLSRDTGTPPGGVHFDWSDTGMHVKVAEE